MKRKALKELPLPEDDIANLHELAKDARKNCNYIVTGQFIEHPCTQTPLEPTVVANCYKVSDDKRNDIYLEFRIYMQAGDYITEDFSGEKPSWKTGGFDYLASDCWWSVRHRETATDLDEAILMKGLEAIWPEAAEYDCAMEALDQYQKHIRADRLAKKHKKETDLIDEQMAKFGEIPEDYEEFTVNRLFADDNFIFYNSKKKTAYCSACGTDFRYNLENSFKDVDRRTTEVLDKTIRPKHNEFGICPYCNRQLQFKSQGYGRQKMFFVHWSVLVQPHGEEVFTRYFCHTKDFQYDFRNPLWHRSEQFRAVHTASGVTDYEWNTYKQTNILRWGYMKNNYYNYWSPAETVLPSQTTLYNASLDEVTKGTWLKYSCTDTILDYYTKQKHSSPWAVDQYFDSYRRWPWLEQLIKLGFMKMAYNYVSDYHRTDVQPGKTICETLGINRMELKLLKQIKEPDWHDIHIIGRFRTRLKREPSLEELEVLRSSDLYDKKIDMMQYTTLHKLGRYLKEHVRHERDYLIDYLGYLQELGYDMHNEFNLFPKDFYTVHDRLSEQVICLHDKKKAEELKLFNTLIKKMAEESADLEAMNMHLEGLFIRLPHGEAELRKEGESLHHCVATYAQRVAEGKTMIFFIRKEEDPDTSYYTLEWKGKVIQCRGNHNCSMTPEVKAFVQIFEEKMKEYEKEERKAS